MLINKIAKRRRKYVAEPMAKQMNKVYNDIMNITLNLFPKTDEGKAKREKYIVKALKDIANMQKPIFVLCNVMRLEFNKECFWCDYLNREIALLNGMLRDEKNKVNTRVEVLDWDVINKMEVLSNASELHRTIHGKVVRAVGCLENADAPLLITLTDDFLYNVMIANTIYPETREQYEQRAKLLNKAKDELHKIQRPLLAFFNIMQYSDRVQEEIARMIYKEKKLIDGLIKSDIKRFGMLK